MKTGALFRFACEAGACSARRRWRSATRCRVTGPRSAQCSRSPTTFSTWKASRRGRQGDRQGRGAGKATLVALLGVDGARARLKQLVDDADRALTPFGADAAMLKATARFVAERRAREFSGPVDNDFPNLRSKLVTRAEARAGAALDAGLC